jgi:alkylation response protein AidB-like acyl-CoA dehydrogenase
MPLILNDEQSMMRDTIRDFIGDKAPLAHLRKLRDRRDETGFSRELWAAFAEMGLCGLRVPEEQGGQGLGHVEAGIVMEEIGRNLTPSPFLSTALLAATALASAGSMAQKQEHLPKMASGQLIAALASDEKAKHAPAAISLRAERSGNGFRLNGSKSFVIDGHAADMLILAARSAGGDTEENGITLFLVDPKAAGIEIERTAMVDAHNAARIDFRNVEVTADAVLGEVDQGWPALNAVLNVGRAAVAAEMLGVGEGAFVPTMAYLRDRKQFGRPIGSFQALQHRAAHLYGELEITRAAVLKALQMLDDAPEKAGPYVAIAKARAGKTATLAVQEGVQMHGGIGMTDEFDIGFFMKRARVCQELFGDANYQANALAQLNGY